MKEKFAKTIVYLNLACSKAMNKVEKKLKDNSGEVALDKVISICVTLLLVAIVIAILQGILGEEDKFGIWTAIQNALSNIFNTN